MNCVTRITGIGMAACVLGLPATLQAIDLSGYEIVDLSQVFDEHTLYWPTSPSRFELHPLAHGQTEATAIPSSHGRSAGYSSPRG